MDQASLIAAIAVLIWTCVVTLAAVALTIIVRNAPIVRGWVQEAKMPWACNICMPLYTCAVFVGALCALHQSWAYLLPYLPAYVLSKILLDKLAEPPNDPEIPMSLMRGADSGVEEISLEEDLSDDLVDTGPHALPPALRTNRRV